MGIDIFIFIYLCISIMYTGTGYDIAEQYTYYLVSEYNTL